jgi:hypothetical protein
VRIIVVVLLCCLAGLCASYWVRYYYEKHKVKKTRSPESPSAKYEDDPEPLTMTPLKPVMIGAEVAVTLDLETLERECLALGLPWPCQADGRPRELQRGLRGRIEDVSFYDRTAKLSGGIHWVPIRALSGFETWSCGQERLQVQNATGEYADFVNGSYTLSLDPHTGQVAWRKDGAGDKWLVLFDTGLWYLTSTERMLTGQAGGWLESSRADVSDPSRAGPWRVWTGVTWDLQSSVVVERFRTLAADSSDRIDLCRPCTTYHPAIANAPGYSSNGLARAGVNRLRYIEESGGYDGFSQIVPSYG